VLNSNYRPTTHHLTTLHKRDKPTNHQRQDTVYCIVCISLYCQWIT